MDINRIQQIRDELLRDRKTLIAVSAVAFILFAGTLVAGFVLFQRAINDARVSTHSVDTPTQVGLLFADHKPGDVLNHIVFFHDIHLESGPADNVYYAVGTEGNKVLVVAMGSKPAIDEETAVNVQGTVRPVPPTAEMKKKWKLNKEQIAAIREQGVFIEADEIARDKASTSRLAKK